MRLVTKAFAHCRLITSLPLPLKQAGVRHYCKCEAAVQVGVKHCKKLKWPQVGVEHRKVEVDG